MHTPKNKKAPKTPKHQKHKDATKQKHKTLQANSKGYGGPTKPIIVLSYIRRKTSFLGPFKKHTYEQKLVSWDQAYIETKTSSLEPNIHANLN